MMAWIKIITKWMVSRCFKSNNKPFVGPYPKGLIHCQGNLLIAEGGLRVVLADFDLSVETQGHVAKCRLVQLCISLHFMADKLGK